MNFLSQFAQLVEHATCLKHYYVLSYHNDLDDQAVQHSYQCAISLDTFFQFSSLS